MKKEITKIHTGRVRSIQESVSKPGKRLIEFVNEHGYENAVQEVGRKLDQAFKWHGEKPGGMDRMIAEEIVEDFGYLKTEDIGLAMRMIMKGELGTNYGKFGVATIYKGLQEYANRWQEEQARHNYHRYNESETSKPNEASIKGIREICDRLRADEEEERNRYLAEFQKARKKDG